MFNIAMGKNIWKIKSKKPSWNNFHRPKQEKIPHRIFTKYKTEQNKQISIYLSKKVALVVFILYLYVKIRISILNKLESAEV